MHEYTVVSELVTGLLRSLKGVDGTVVSVHLKKGELRILSDAALGLAFEILRSGTRLEEASLQVETIPTSVHCRACGYAGPAAHLDDKAFRSSIPVLTCPRCGGEVKVTSGRELFVDSVRVASRETPGGPGQESEEGRCRSSGGG